jgi:hypothetical protein
MGPQVPIKHSSQALVLTDLKLVQQSLYFLLNITLFKYPVWLWELPLLSEWEVKISFFFTKFIHKISEGGEFLTALKTLSGRE